jgi:hypothetical protein
VHGEVSRREGRNCIERVGTYKTRMWYCICDNKDGCNAAPVSPRLFLRQQTTAAWYTQTAMLLFVVCSLWRIISGDNVEASNYFV